MSDPPLAIVFLAQSDLVVPADDVARLENLLRSVVDASRAAWPALSVPTDVFLRHLADRVAERPEGVLASDVIETVEALHGPDLFLACACASCDANAIALFEARFLENIDRALFRIGIPAWAVDETKQVLRVRFLLPRGTERASSIASYSGRGSLQAWVTAAAVNAAFRVVQTPKQQTEVDSFVMKAVAAPTEDLELDYWKRRYASEFEQALKETFASLSSRDRNILRCYHLDGAGVDGVAAVYGVHRVTVWRWVKAITKELREKTQTRMVERMRSNRADVASVLELIQSRLDSILRSVLATTSVEGA